MYRMLIVDDEQIIVDSIFYFLNRQEQLGLDLYRANSAYEALELLRKNKFDIILTDICMPGMDGLELLDTIKRYWPMCRVIIFTGHSNFDYAYHVLKYSGVSYLLKIDDFDKILRVVEREITELDHFLKKEELITSLGRRITSVMPVLQREVLGRILQFDYNGLTQQDLDDVNIPLSVNYPVLLLIGRLDKGADSLTVPEHGKRCQGIDIILEKTLHVRNIRSAVYIWGNEIVWLLQQTSGEDPIHTEEFMLYVYEMLPSVQNQCLKQLDVTLSFVLGCKLIQWDQIHDTYRRLGIFLNYSIGLNKGIVMQEQEKNPAVKEAEILYVDVKDLQQMQAVIQAGKKDFFLSEISKHLDRIREEKSMNNIAAIETFAAISWLLVSQSRQWGLFDNLSEKHDITALLKAGSFHSWSEGVSILLDVIDDLFLMRENRRVKDTAWAIEKIKTYVQNHYAEELSLVSLSEIVHFNPSYISRLFKEVEGINLQEYINEVRIFHAKELLDKTGLRVGEIANQSGFGSPKYFIAVFKKITGVTPQVWRESFVR